MRSLACAAVVVALSASLLAAEREGPTSAALMAGTVPVTPAVGGTGRTGESNGPERLRVQWTQVPQLVVLMSVMRYHGGSGVEYSATTEVLSGAEADELIADLTQALALLTDGRFSQFAAIHREVVQPGATTRITRSGRIVVGRYDGIRELRQTVGFGGRVPDRDRGIASAAVLLDSGYDRTSSQRRLLRIHELGHALGYDHVDAHPSIMNPRIGTPPTDFDRQAARLSFSSRQ